MTSKRRQELLLSALPLGWLLMFFVIPCVVVLSYAFRSSDLQGGLGTAWTLETLLRLADPAYLPIVARTLTMSVFCTLFCVGLALPISLQMVRCSPAWRGFLMAMIILPFLTNLLIRIFAWKSLLHTEGFAKQVLVFLHLATEDSQLLNHSGTVLLLMIYTQLPMAILPLYAAAEKFDLQLLDAARDLGATSWQAARRVFLPGIQEGILSASAMTFICSLGQYVVPQLVGGTRDEMIGNKIVQRAFSDRNLPLACAMAGSLLMAILIGLVLFRLIAQCYPKWRES
jgi:spermidine/putrescine transport system permease protein